MSQQTRKTIHLLYGLVLTALILVTAVSFAVSCVQIYRLGDSPFTYETIGERFDRLALPSYLTVVGVVVGQILALCLPVEEGKIRPVADAAVMLERLRNRLDRESCSEATVALMAREAMRRRRIMTVSTLFAAAVFVPALVWFADPDHFTVENLNGDILVAACFILPAAALALVGRLVALILRYASVRRETEAVRAALRLQGSSASRGAVPARRDPWADPRFLWPLRGGILAVGVLFIILGIRNGGMADVLGKAIRICTECIGLG